MWSRLLHGTVGSLSLPLFIQCIAAASYLFPFFVYACAGAILRILLHFFLRSSAPTTPLTRVPMGSPALLMRTQALSSNLTTLPSGRCTCFRVRTTMACRMSPRFTLFAAEAEPIPASEAPRCFWTIATMRSPTEEKRQVVLAHHPCWRRRGERRREGGSC